MKKSSKNHTFPLRNQNMSIELWVFAGVYQGVQWNSDNKCCVNPDKNDVILF